MPKGIQVIGALIIALVAVKILTATATRRAAIPLVHEIVFRAVHERRAIAIFLGEFEIVVTLTLHAPHVFVVPFCHDKRSRRGRDEKWFSKTSVVCNTKSLSGKPTYHTCPANRCRPTSWHSRCVCSSNTCSFLYWMCHPLQARVHHEGWRRWWWRHCRFPWARP